MDNEFVYTEEQAEAIEAFINKESPTTKRVKDIVTTVASGCAAGVTDVILESLVPMNVKPLVRLGRRIGMLVISAYVAHKINDYVEETFDRAIDIVNETAEKMDKVINEVNEKEEVTE